MRSEGLCQLLINNSKKNSRKAKCVVLCDEANQQRKSRDDLSLVATEVIMWKL